MIRRVGGCLSFACARIVHARRFLSEKVAFSKWLKKCELQRLYRWTCTRTSSHRNTHRDIAAAEKKTNVVSPTHGHGGCRSKVPAAFVSHADFSAGTYSLEQCSCASLVCLPPSPTLTRLYTPFFIFLPRTLNLQDKPSTPRHRNSVACGDPQGAHLSPHNAHIVWLMPMSQCAGVVGVFFFGGLDRV